jgi:predicted MPP superfamily phosphohydrolase
MPEFRLTQISDTHLTRRHQKLTDNFHRISEYIDATRPDLVVNSGDLAYDAPTSPDDYEFARELHSALPVACRYIPGNHDVGDNLTGLVRPRLIPSPNRAGRLSSRSSARIAGASTPRAGASSASTRLS